MVIVMVVSRARDTKSLVMLTTALYNNDCFAGNVSGSPTEKNAVNGLRSMDKVPS